MAPVNVLQPTEFAVITREALGDRYEEVCDLISLPPTDEGYGILMGFRPDMGRVTMLTANVGLIRQLVAMPPHVRNDYALSESDLPAIHHGWLDLPADAILATCGRIARFGPGDRSLGPDRVVFPITYLEDGVETGTGYARADELAQWINDLTADGWIVDDRPAVPRGALPPDYEKNWATVRRGAALADQLRGLTVPPDYQPIAASITEAATLLCTLAEGGESPTSPAALGIIGALADALADHDAYPADRRPA